MSFEFFERETKKVRRYWDVADDYHDILREKPEYGGAIRIVPSTRRFDIVEGTHAMRPGNPRGLDAVGEAFNVRLPDDAHEFYKRWDGGLLLQGAMCELLKADEIIEENRRIRELRGHRVVDWPVIRFAHLGDSNYIGFFFRDDRCFVAFVSAGFDEEGMARHGSHSSDAPCVLSDSFTTWFADFIKQDGAVPEMDWDVSNILIE